VRPTGLIIQALKGYAGRVTFRSAGTEMLIDSPLSILALGLVSGDHVEISIDGPEEAIMCAKLVELLERHFDFPS
jgi:phosphotransferase system HPr (HPr) family protein